MKIMFQVEGPMTMEKVLRFQEIIQGKGNSMQALVYGLALADVDLLDFNVVLTAMTKD